MEYEQSRTTSGVRTGSLRAPAWRTDLEKEYGISRGQQQGIALGWQTVTSRPADFAKRRFDFNADGDADNGPARVTSYPLMDWYSFADQQVRYSALARTAKPLFHSPR